MNNHKRDILNHTLTTPHLTLLEQGILCVLTDLYLTEEIPLLLDINQLCRLIRAASPDEKKAVGTILNEFFEKTDTGWFNEENDRQIKNYQARSKVNKRNASKPRKRIANEPLEDSLPIASNSLAKPEPSASKPIADSYQTDDDELVDGQSDNLDSIDIVYNQEENISTPANTDPFNIEDFINHTQTSDFQIENELLREDINLLTNGYHIVFDPIASGYQKAYDPLLEKSYPFDSESLEIDDENSEPLTNSKRTDIEPESPHEQIANDKQPHDDGGEKTVGQGGAIDQTDSVESLTGDLQELLEFMDEPIET